MLNIISFLLQFIFNSTKYLFGFLVIVCLGIVSAVLYALPWLLRAASLLLWLAAAYIGFTAIQVIYTPFSPAIPVIALQFAIILISVGWVIIVLNKNSSFIWGGLTAGGLVVIGASAGSIWLLTHWSYASLFFRVLPPALFSTLLIYETLRLRSLRRKRNMPPAANTDEPEETTAQ